MDRGRPRHQPVVAGAASPKRLEMKMCSISVAPMPSRMGLPVFCTQSLNTGAGKVSPADTAARNDERLAPWFIAASMAR